jgi:hypothetical protein
MEAALVHGRVGLSRYAADKTHYSVVLPLWPAADGFIASTVRANAAVAVTRHGAVPQ